MDSVELSAAEHFVLVNTTRSLHTRAVRRAQPGRVRAKQFVGDNGVRLMRQRPVVVTGEWVTTHLGELREKSSWGVLEVRTLDGRRLDLSELTVQAAPVDPPQPSFLPDSAALDKPHFGHNVQKFPGAKTLEETIAAEAALAEAERAEAAATAPAEPTTEMSQEAADLFAQAAEDMSTPEEAAPEAATEESAPAESDQPAQTGHSRKGRRR